MVLIGHVNICIRVDNVFQLNHENDNQETAVTSSRDTKDMVMLVELDLELCHHKHPLSQASGTHSSSPHNTHTTTHNSTHM